MTRSMLFRLSAVLFIAAAVLKDRADLVAENVALRHQLSCLMHRGPRPRLRPVDRFWSGWRESLVMVKPATVLAWHRKVFKLFWRGKSRKRGLTRKLRFLPPHPHRSSKADHPDGNDERRLGSSTSSRRIAQAGHCDIGDHRFTLCVQTTRASWLPTAMGNVFAKSPARDSCSRFRRRANGDVWHYTIKRILLENGFDPIRKKGTSWKTFLKAQCGGGNIVSEYCSDRLFQCRSDHSVWIDSIVRSLRHRSQDPRSSLPHPRS
jgi:hypothetical protein